MSFTKKKKKAEYNLQFLMVMSLDIIDWVVVITMMSQQHNEVCQIFIPMSKGPRLLSFARVTFQIFYICFFITRQILCLKSPAWILLHLGIRVSYFLESAELLLKYKSFTNLWLIFLMKVNCDSPCNPWFMVTWCDWGLRLGALGTNFSDDLR